VDLVRIGDSHVAVSGRLEVRGGMGEVEGSGEGVACGWKLEVGGIMGEVESEIGPSPFFRDWSKPKPSEQLAELFNRLLGQK
jgi:hypothetical protein